ncbi:MAG: GNAT family N-acetyltransferase [bacterium]|nr:GNAT family N-acetyltransferase [bacterium]
MENLIIRNATVEDAPQIATIHVRGWQCAYRGQIPDKYLDGLSIEKRTKTWTKQIQEKKPGEHIYIAELNKKIVGWYTAGKSRDKDAAKDTGELQGIYIHPYHVGQGVGSKIMNHVINSLKRGGYKKATLWVLETNTIARRFYEKRGWVVEGKTKIEKKDGFDLHEIRLVLVL